MTNREQFPERPPHTSAMSDMLIEALTEQGESIDDSEQLLLTLHALRSWSAPIPTPLETQRLLTSLQAHMPAISPARQALIARENTTSGSIARLFNLASMQVSVLRPSFWLLTSFITAYGFLTLLFVPGSSQLLLQALGPLLAFISTAHAFRNFQHGVIECELACPPSFWQLVCTRLMLILGYDILLGLLLSLPSLLYGGNNILIITVGWLMPMLLVTGLGLALSLWLPIVYASLISYTAWIALLLLPQLNTQMLPSFSGITSLQGELVLGAFGVLCILSTLRYMKERSLRLPQQSG